MTQRRLSNFLRLVGNILFGISAFTFLIVSLNSIEESGGEVHKVPLNTGLRMAFYAGMLIGALSALSGILLRYFPRPHEDTWKKPENSDNTHQGHRPSS